MRFADHFDLVQDEGQSARERGHALEELARVTFSEIQGLVCIMTHAVDAHHSQEHDLVFRVEADCRALHFAAPVLPVECKNWADPVGASVVGSFAFKLSRFRVPFGVLLSKHGVTGDLATRLAAYGALHDASESARISVLSLDDLGRVQSGDELADAIVENAFSGMLANGQRPDARTSPSRAKGLDEARKRIRAILGPLRVDPETLGPSEGADLRAEFGALYELLDEAKAPAAGARWKLDRRSVKRLEVALARAVDELARYEVVWDPRLGLGAANGGGVRRVGDLDADREIVVRRARALTTTLEAVVEVLTALGAELR